MFNLRVYKFWLLLFLPTVFVLGQNLNANVPDSLKKLSFKLIKENFWKKYDITDEARIIAIAYYQKAKTLNDFTEITGSFDFLARLYSEEQNIAFADSLIYYSTLLKSKTYPSVGYSLKGYNYYALGDYENALDNYLKAYESAKAKNNDYQLIEITQVIGALKNRWGDYEEALEIYKEHLKLLYSYDVNNPKYREDYLITLYNLSLSYQRNKKYDSSAIYIAKGIREANSGKDSLYLRDFKHANAVNLYLLGDHEESQKTFLNLKSNEKDSFKEAITNYYLGRIAFKEGKAEMGIAYYQKVDSIFRINNQEYPELREVYEELVTHFRNVDAPDKELAYIRQLLIVDSSLAHNREYLNQTIIKKYETPELIDDQNALIADLSGKNRRTSILSYIFGGSVIVLLIPLVFYYKKSVRNAKMFHELQAKRKGQSKNKVIGKNIITNEVETLITNKLNQFEEDLRFTDENLSLNSLAKQIGSNSTYVSRVINDSKGKNFSNYISDLRIEHLLHRLDNESILINYKIQSLGEEVGYKNSEAFSKAFFKYTQMKPSFYLKKLRDGR